jgi:probable metal-binding protein
MNPPTSVHGHEVIDLVAAHPNGIRLSHLAEIVATKYGRSVTFHTCSMMGLDFDDLLVFLEAREKLRIVKGVVIVASSPACVH